MTRWMRAVLLGGLAFKATVLGALAWAERGHEAKGHAEEAPAALTAHEAGVAAELFEKSRGFRDLVEAVGRRNAELDQREQAVASRETALRALEQMLAGDVARLEGAGGAASPAGDETSASEATASGDPTAAAACSVAVTRIYASMKPEEAGPILDRLDDATVRTVFGCMKERQIGAILAAMQKERAVALTKLLASTGGTLRP